MLERLRGLFDSKKPKENDEEKKKQEAEQDQAPEPETLAPEESQDPPLASPISADEETLLQEKPEIPLASPVEQAPPADNPPPVAEPVSEPSTGPEAGAKPDEADLDSLLEAELGDAPEEPPSASSAPPPPESPPLASPVEGSTCPMCETACAPNATYCDDCGYVFPEGGSEAPPTMPAHDPGSAPPTMTGDQFGSAPPTMTAEDMGSAPPTMSPEDLDAAPPTMSPQDLDSAPPTMSPEDLDSAPPTMSPEDLDAAPPTMSPEDFDSAPPTMSPEDIASAPPTMSPEDFDSAPPTMSPKDFDSAPPTMSPEDFPSAPPTMSPEGYGFAPPTMSPQDFDSAPPTMRGVSVKLRDRYERLDPIGERLGVYRYRGIDTGLTGAEKKPVLILQQKVQAQVAPPTQPESAPPDDESTDLGEEEILPGFDTPDAVGPPTEKLPSDSIWPSLAWERHIMETVELPGMPTVLESFTEGDIEYLIVELPTGRSLWDAWDDYEATYEDRYGWLAQIAEVLHMMYQAGAILEHIRPDFIVIDDQGNARLTMLEDLLPVPVPADVPIRGTLYTAPELVSNPGSADGRATLYSFGAMLFALRVGRELTDIDFEKQQQGHPKPFIPHFPDVHPLEGRLMTKTFRREPDARFPSDEAALKDPSGLGELTEVLKTCARTMDRVRFEIGSWTTTGIVRTGNEDAFALLHNCEARQEDVTESVLILLCDGMGGYEAGEVAASMAISELRKSVLAQPMFQALTGKHGYEDEIPTGEGNMVPMVDPKEAMQIFKQALVDANKAIHAASKANPARRGMGCTAELVYLDSRNLIVGHVGDSRTYHYRDGTLTQVTRDQTLVNRLVELGQLTPEEAETHPRRNELQQALGGQPHVEPLAYHMPLRARDIVVVCSDGLVNHVDNKTLEEFLRTEGDYSAELSARHLVNLANIHGATDNTTVVLVRAT